MHNSEKKACCHDDLNELVQAICMLVKPDDHILVMSNGGFGGIHEKILSDLQSKPV